jgi:uncharacterized protein (TIGR00251 family)
MEKMMTAPCPDTIAALMDAGGEMPVRVVPGARVEKAAVENGALKIWIRTAPEDGKANKAVIELLAKIISVPRSNVEIIKGLTSRDKRVRITLNPLK